MLYTFVTGHVAEGMANALSARLTLVTHIINHYFPRHRATDFRIKLVETEEFFAQNKVVDGTKPTLSVAIDTFFLSPAFLATAIGHEMGHAEQLQRIMPRLQVLNKLEGAFGELEAYHWQLNRENTRFEFGANPFLSCMQKQEREVSEQMLACSSWDVMNALKQFAAGEGARRYAGPIEQWMEHDPWISRVWLPHNLDWRDRPLEPRPSFCRSASR